MKIFLPLRRFSRLTISVLAAVCVTITGIFGYMEIEGMHWLDAVYMTVITISTVGFGEVVPLSPAGRIFTIILIVAGFIIFAYAITAISSYLFTGEFRRYFKDRRVKHQIEQLKGHVVICGFGRNGKRAAEVLAAHRQEFVVIESDHAIIEELRAAGKTLFIDGDAKEDEILERARIENAKALICSLPNDADNLLIVLTARGLNPKLTIVSRASHDSSDKKLRLAGADNVSMPDRIGGAHMASLVLKSDVMDFIDHVVTRNPEIPFISELSCADIMGDQNNHSLKEVRSKLNPGVAVLGYKNVGGDYVVNPQEHLELANSTKLFLWGDPSLIQSITK